MTKPKETKRNKWETEFIKEYGAEYYQEMLEDFPELKHSPELFESVIKLIPLFDIPATPELTQAFDKFLNTPSVIDGKRIDEDEGGSND